MKKFIFTLQAPLNVKRAQEKQLMGELAECNARIREFERVLQEHLAFKEEQNRRYEKDITEGLTPYSMMFWRWAHLTIRDRILYQQNVLETAEGERARIETRLITVMRDRKVLEKLREAQWEEYRAEERRQAAVEIAEFVGHAVFVANE